VRWLGLHPRGVRCDQARDCVLSADAGPVSELRDTNISRPQLTVSTSPPTTDWSLQRPGKTSPQTRRPLSEAVIANISALAYPQVLALISNPLRTNTTDQAYIFLRFAPSAIFTGSANVDKVVGSGIDRRGDAFYRRRHGTHVSTSAGKNLKSFHRRRLPTFIQAIAASSSIHATGSGTAAAAAGTVDDAKFARHSA
jgi:hypothetical protein